MEVDFKLYETFNIMGLYSRITDKTFSGRYMYFVGISPSTSYYYEEIGYKIGIPASKWNVFLKDVCFVYENGKYYFNSVEDANKFARCLIALTSGLPEHRPLANQIKDNYERSVLGIENTERKSINRTW